MRNRINVVLLILRDRCLQNVNFRTLGNVVSTPCVFIIEDTLHKNISVDACKTFISLLDVDGSGRLGFTEFLYLWSMLRSWKKLFYQYDTDRSGTLRSHELRRVLGAAGFKVNNSTIRSLIFRYSNEKHQIDLDNFLICLAKLTKLFNVYKDFKQNEHAVFTLDQWLEQSLLV
ncbi:hypothetical protein ScPMuIL_014478 [Solemya velum]